MKEGTQGTLVLLTFLGMVGLYVGAWMAYQKWQTYSAAVSTPAGAANTVLSLLRN